LVRPLLPIPRARLAATLTAAGQAWIDDPSNRDPRHARVRLRQALPALAEAGLPASRLAEAAAHLARARAALDHTVADLLARAAAPHPAGYLHLALPLLAEAPEEVSLRALAHCLLTIGGGRYAPRFERLERLHAEVLQGRALVGRTLGGCRILGHRGDLLICREAAQADDVLAVRPGLQARWDGRFAITVPSRADLPADLTLRCLGEAGWRTARDGMPALRDAAIPAPARTALPAIWGARDLLAVPHLGYFRAGNGELDRIVIEFAARPLAGASFTVA
jgi:tRNA(Ile)-lysidine synthase